MSQPKSRRELALLATGGLLATGLAATYAKPAAAERQGNMVNAKGSLEEALHFLTDASTDKGGHREAAISLVQRAIEEVNAGIRFANQH